MHPWTAALREAALSGTLASVLSAAWRHTAVGSLTHHLAATFWAVLHARVLQHRPEASRPLPALAAAATTATVAAITDLKFTPERFTPGFQHRVPPPALALAYACFAVGLAVGSVAARRAGR